MKSCKNMFQNAAPTPPKLMPLDDEIAALVEAMEQAPYIDLAALPLSEALGIARAMRPLPRRQFEGIAMRDIRLDVPGDSILLRLYRPVTAGALPVILHLHGGGWVTGSVERDEARCCEMAEIAQALVVSVDYRLSPEYPFPIPVEDGVAAWEWVLGNIGDIGGDPDRTAVSGASAGGHIAACMLLALRARGRALPHAQLLTYPALDPELRSASYSKHEFGPFMTRARMAWYWGQYLNGPCAPGSLSAAPLREDLSRLPPAFVQVAEYDVLRDDGVAYAERLARFGVPAELRLYPGMIHGFIAVAPSHRDSRRAVAEGCRALTCLWDGESEPSTLASRRRR
jgi:acetyl esterase